MKHLFLLAVCASAALNVQAAPKAKGAAPKAKGATPKAKGAAPAKTALKTLNYCPIAGEKLHSRTVGPTTYKNYKIAFCCPGCPEAFAALSPKEKDVKIARIVAKQAKAKS